MTRATTKTEKAAVLLFRNPLGIIALFIVLVDSIAGLVLVFGNGLGDLERLILVYFIALFPVIVFGAFVWLVANHHTKLFAPADYRDEENFLRARQAINTAAYLGAASGKKGTPFEVPPLLIEDAVKGVLEARERSGEVESILWVDDHPENNSLEQCAFEAAGYEVQFVTNTEDALKRIAQGRVSLVITDMVRGDDPRAGYTLLNEIRKHSDLPVYIYTGSTTLDQQSDALEKGANGQTSGPGELFQMVNGRRYYINKNAQKNGDHEVHKAGCSWMPLAENRIYLGEFSGCAPALKEAKKHYSKTNGCYYCSRDCHTV